MDLNPFYYATSDPRERVLIAKLRKAGKVRAIGPRLYTSLPAAQVPAATRAAWGEIVFHLFPDALLSYRSALEYRPTPKNKIFLTASTNRQVEYPGLTLVFVRGPAPLADDPPFLRGRAASLPRALLENMHGTQRSHDRSLTPEDIESRLESLLQNGGEEKFRQLRKQAQSTAKKLRMPHALRRLDSLMGALLGTRSERSLVSSRGKARAQGKPFDVACVHRFDLLFATLRHASLPELVERYSSPAHVRNKAFFEAYFSNFIEGTTFEVAEAESIIFDKKIPAQRPKDGHDILGTFQLVSNSAEMKILPNEFNSFLALLQRRHHTLLSARPEIQPGMFKTKVNRAGSTFFPEPNLVIGTLESGFARYLNLPPGLARSIFMLFLVSEVHPFADGNGRVARVFMNAELHQQKLSSVIIPTVYREDYLLALRALTRRERAQPLVDMLVRAQRFSALNFSNYPSSLQLLTEKNWFAEADEAKIVE